MCDELIPRQDRSPAAELDDLGAADVAVLATLMLLQLSFGNWRLAILSLLTLPMALVGGVLAATVGGGVISLGSLVGFLTVMGSAARNGILMIALPASGTS